jgi:hypothetical protein
VVLLTSVLAINAAFGAASTKKIDAVRRKALVDKDVLENFLLSETCRYSVAENHSLLGRSNLLHWFCRYNIKYLFGFSGWKIEGLKAYVRKNRT